MLPSYTAAYLTEQMVYVVPTLAAAGFFAASLSLDTNASRRHVDEDAADPDDGSETDLDESGSITSGSEDS